MRLIRMFSILALLASGATALPVSPSYGADTRAQALLQSIYRVYETSDKAVDLGSETKAARYFVPSLAKLIGRDIATAKKKKEVGTLDFDPFIGGQDWSPTKIELNVPAGAKEQTTVTLDLDKTGAGWRISDIHWAGQSESLDQVLTKKN
jgi:hypothetical protein